MSVWWSGTSTAAAVQTAREKSVLVSDLYSAIKRDYEIEKKRTLRNVEGAWENHLRAEFGADPIIPFRPSRIEKYVLGRRRAGAANATINRELAVLKRMASLAVEQRESDFEDEKLLVALTRWSHIKFLDESDNVREQVFPNELYDAFAREAGKVGLWFRTMFEICYTRGWRPGSLRQLQVKNLDLMRRTIRLTRKQTKNKKPTEIGMTDVEYELVRQCCAGKGPEDYVLTREKDWLGRKPKNGGRIVDYRKDWKRVCDAVGVTPGKRGLIFYDLKRAAATNLIDSGLDEKEAMLNTGQKTPSVFRRYQQVSAEKLQEAARKIERGHRERQAAARFKQAEMFGDKIPPGRAS